MAKYTIESLQTNTLKHLNIEQFFYKNKVFLSLQMLSSWSLLKNHGSEEIKKIAQVVFSLK